MSEKSEARTAGWRLETLPFERIDEPGTYYLHATGGLCRIPSEALRPGHSPVIEIVSRGNNQVTKLSDDPFVPLSKVRMLAADADLEVNF